MGGYVTTEELVRWRLAGRCGAETNHKEGALLTPMVCVAPKGHARMDRARGANEAA